MKAAGIAWMAALVLCGYRLAADPLPAEIALARRLFAEARTAEGSKEWGAASSKLREAIAIKETAGLRFHLAYCEEQQGMLVEALNDYERAEDLLTQPNDDFRAQLPSKKESLHKRIPTITLVMPPDVAEATLAVDDHPLSASFLGKAIPLNPGRHTVVVASPNRTTFTAELTLNETDAVVTNAPMLPVAKPAPAAPLQTMTIPDNAGSKSSSLEGGLPVRTYVLIGEAVVTAGALAVGIGYTVAASSEDSTVASLQAMLGNDGCSLPPVPASCADLPRAIDRARKDRSIATIGFVGAGVGAAAFVGTFVLWPAARRNVALAPLVVPNVAGLSVAGRF